MLSTRVVFAVILGTALGAPAPGAAPASKPGAPAPAAKLGAAAHKAGTPFGDDFVGSGTCQMCHEDIYRNFRKSAHTFVETDKRGGWSEHGCESCHGPGGKHAGSASADDIKNPAKLTAVETDKLCLSCHLNTAKHSERISSSHMKDAVACTSCHSMHSNGPAGLVPRAPTQVNALCSSCHKDVAAQFAKPFRHKIPEAEMTCVDCHNPHGSNRKAMVQSAGANDVACTKCHGDKRGPFTFEHGPVRFEGCATCHEPHGSTNPRMLARQEVKSVCLECHANMPAVKTPAAGSPIGVVPPAFHDLRSPRYQNCTVCHQKIHGSYADRNLLK